MALVKVGAIITDIKGKVGGQVFARGIGGLTLKNKGNGPVTYGKEADGFITYSQAVQQEWGKLTTAQRTAWDKFSRMTRSTTRKGENIYLRGYGTFCQYNRYYKKAYGSVLTTPIFASAKTSGVTCELEAPAPGMLRINISRALVSANEFLFYYISSIRLPSRNVDPKALREGGNIITSVDHLDITARYLQMFGLTLAVNDYLYLGWMLFDKQGNIVQKEKAVAVNVK